MKAIIALSVIIIACFLLYETITGHAVEILNQLHAYSQGGAVPIAGGAGGNFPKVKMGNTPPTPLKTNKNGGFFS